MIEAGRFGPVLGPDGVTFRLWAPAAQRVELVGDRCRDMQRSGGGWFTAAVAGATPGLRYHYRIDGGIEVPDPASRLAARSNAKVWKWPVSLPRCRWPS